jgi:hypothetical protein
MDDWERLRLRAQDRDRALTQRQRFPSGATPRLLGRVTTATPAAGKFVKLQPQVITGAEVEGGAATFTDVGPNNLIALGLNNAVPSTGDKLVCHHMPYRWVYEKGGTGSYMLCIQVNRCFGQVCPSQLVTVKQGGTTIGTCTTSSFGSCCVNVPGTGTYTVLVNRTRWNAFSGSVTVSHTGVTPYTADLNVAGPASGYVCCWGYNDPVKTTLQFSDSITGISALPILYNSGTGNWSACSTFNTTQRATDQANCLGPAVTATIPLVCAFQCNPSPTFNVGASISYPGCNAGGGCWAIDTDTTFPAAIVCNSGPPAQLYSNGSLWVPVFPRGIEVTSGCFHAAGPPWKDVPLSETFSCTDPCGAIYGSGTSTTTVTE